MMRMRVRLNGVKSISDSNVQELCARLVCIRANLTEYAPLMDGNGARYSTVRWWRADQIFGLVRVSHRSGTRSISARYERLLRGSDNGVLQGQTHTFAMLRQNHLSCFIRKHW